MPSKIIFFWGGHDAIEIVLLSNETIKFNGNPDFYDENLQEDFG